jgi:hypothetical protein
MLAYGVIGRFLDEYLRISETTCLDVMYRLYRDVIAVFGDLYLMESTVAGTIFLTWSVPIMTSTCSSALQYSSAL